MGDNIRSHQRNKLSLINANRSTSEWIEEYIRLGRPIYDRLPSETDPAFDNYVHYRDIGPERTLTLVAKLDGHLGEDSVAKYRPGQYAEQSAKNCWVRRCQAYDEHIRELQQQVADTHAIIEAGSWAHRRAIIREQRFRLAQLILSKVVAVVSKPDFILAPGAIGTWADWAFNMADVSSISEMNESLTDNELKQMEEMQLIDPGELTDKDLWRVIEESKDGSETGAGQAVVLAIDKVSEANKPRRTYKKRQPKPVR
jgi:hypothetical protein